MQLNVLAQLMMSANGGWFASIVFSIFVLASRCGYAEAGEGLEAGLPWAPVIQSLCMSMHSLSLVGSKGEGFGVFAFV